ncbi:MAG: rod shape-determining protein MreD [Coriobacteriia bacterium]|nr:rod shape-determining protein MreD [Coriobacteriia bacterium]
MLTLNNKVLAAIVALLLAFLLQVAVGPSIAIMSVRPNFLLVVTIIMALVNGPVEGTLVGFSAGILLDLLGTGAFGPAALVMCVVGYLAGVLHERIFAQGWLLPVLVLAVSSFLYELFYLVVILLLGQRMSFFSALFTKAIPTVLYTTLVAVVVFPALSRLLREKPMMTTVRHMPRGMGGKYE